MRDATRRFILLACSAYVFLPPLLSAETQTQTVEEPLLASVRRSIVKITAVRQNIDFQNPWLFSQSLAASGSGFFVGKGRLITNAHVVSNARFITVQKDGDSRQYSAFVEFIAHDCDLAVLNVQDKEFFAGLKPLPLGGIPKLRSPVSTVGYPAGGEQIAVTKGIVSRIDYSLYVHTDYHLHLLVQVDSAINPGASGGPVLQKGRVVGVAFQAFRVGENIGYIIPVPVIKRFLKDISSGTYRGHPETGIAGRAWLIDNEATARFHGIREGFKLVEIAPWSSYKDKFQEGDILLEIDHQAIGSDGNVPYYGERISFYALFDLKGVGEKVTFKIKRGDKILVQTFKVEAPVEHAFNGLSYLKHPSYLVVGGLVFTELSQSYLETWGDEWMRRIPPFFRYLISHSDEDSDLMNKRSFVVLTKRLPHEFNQYADGFQNAVVRKVNNVEISSFEDFQRVVKTLSGNFLHIEFYHRDEELYLPIKGLLESHQAINDSYGVQPDSWSDRRKDGAVSWGERKE